MSNGAAAAATAAAAIANATKASGVLVRVEQGDFSLIIGKMKNPLVIHAVGGVFGRKYSYLTSYKGLAFYVRSKTPIHLPSDAEIIMAKSIWIPK